MTDPVDGGPLYSVYQDPNGLTVNVQGKAGITVYQDVNGNDKMDLTWLGLPLEPYGFSRDAKPVLSKPKFSQVKFTLIAGEQSQTLHLRTGISVLAEK